MRAAVHSKLGQVDDEGNFSLAAVPRAEIERARAKARKAIAIRDNRAFNDMRPAEVAAASAAYLEPFVRAKLEQWEATPKKGRVLTKKIAEARAELARLLTVQGRFSEASEVHEHGRRLAAAAHKPDAGAGAWCSCEATPVDDGTGGHLRPLQFECDEVMSEVHGGVVYHWRCKNFKKCKCENISPEPPPQDAWYYQRTGFHGRNSVRDEQILKA